MFGSTNAIKPNQVSQLLTPTQYTAAPIPQPDAINPNQVSQLLTPYDASEPEPTSAPAWVPWAVGAAIGGGILYLLLRD